jgi:hypothetical protein
LLAQLVRDGRPLPEPWFQQLVELFKSEVAPRWDIEPGKTGHAAISSRLSFNSALGLIAYVILRLSELSAQTPSLLQCSECDKFKIIESTGGDKISRFCSARCRNRFTVRKWRADQKVAPKKSARRHK